MKLLNILLTLTLSGSALAVLLLALRYLLLKKMPSTVYYYAWLLVLLRFALPLPGLVPTAADVPSGTEEAAVAAPVSAERERTNGAGVRWDAVTEAIAAETLPPVQRTDVIPAEENTVPESNRTDAPYAAGSETVLSWKAPELWLGIWAAGTVFCLGTAVLAYLRFTRKLRLTLRAPDRFAREQYAAVPGRKPALYISAGLKTPLMYGLFSPKIVLPEREYDEELLQNILRHELMHCRRRDTLYKWSAVFILSAHWFNPLSWLVRRELNRACELSCDEMLLRSMSVQEKRSYGSTLLNMAAAGAIPAGVVATTFCTEKKNLKERLEQIMTYNKKSRARVLAAVLALVFLVGCGTAAGPSAASIEPEASSDSTKVSDDGRPVVRVSTVDEFLEAIAPDTIIELEAGTYSFPEAADYSAVTNSRYYEWMEAYDGWQLNITGVDNLSLRGAGMGETVLSTDPRYADVVHFKNCSNVEISDLTAGHTKLPGFCAGGVLYFEYCEDIAVDSCGLYGCGTIGVWAMESARITVTDSDIYECSYNAVNFSRCRDVTVTGCNVYRHGVRAGEGSAISVFAADYCDVVRIFRNSIHDNNVQYLLQLNATKGALFLSNEVTGNRLDTSYFAFQQYSATVDGCSFSGNESRGGWYSGGEGRIYASDAEGNLLDPAALESMTYAEIDPETIAPAKSPAAPTEVAPGETIVVTNVDEFLAAIGPDRIIVLDGKLFDLAAASSYGGLGGEYWYWQESYDGPELVIENVSGLSIQSASTVPDDTVLSATPRYANVLNFRNCSDVFLAGFTAGHTKEPGSCAGGVLYLTGCNNVKIEKMRLYGCGILGIQASDCNTLAVLRTEIYECSQGAGQFFMADGITFNDCDVHDVPSPAFVFTECGDKLWNGEAISGRSGSYNVAADGSLTEYTYSDFGYEGDWNGEYAIAVPDDNPFAGEEPVRFADNPAALQFAETVQQLIADGDWEGLADRVSYPLTVLGAFENYSVGSRDVLLAEDFGNVLTEEFRQRIADAPLEEYGHSLFGNTFCDGYLAFSCWGNPGDPDAYRVSCISVVNPLY